MRPNVQGQEVSTVNVILRILRVPLQLGMCHFSEFSLTSGCADGLHEVCLLLGGKSLELISWPLAVFTVELNPFAKANLALVHAFAFVFDFHLALFENVMAQATEVRAMMRKGERYGLWNIRNNGSWSGFGNGSLHDNGSFIVNLQGGISLSTSVSTGASPA